MSARPRGAPYLIRIDEMKLNTAMNVIYFHDADAQKWVVIGWYDAAIRANASRNNNSLQEEITQMNKLLRDGDHYGYGYLHHL